MCVFVNEKEVIEKGLLPNIDSFPIPIKHDFGGDVILGWRSWGFKDGRLISPNMYTPWPVGSPMKAGDVPSTHTGRGVYCYALRSTVGSPHTIFGRVALWGRVLNFDGKYDSRKGAMGEFAYPLELYVGGLYTAKHKVAQQIAGAYGPSGVHVYLGNKKVA